MTHSLTHSLTHTLTHTRLFSKALAVNALKSSSSTKILSETRRHFLRAALLCVRVEKTSLQRSLFVTALFYRERTETSGTKTFRDTLNICNNCVHFCRRVRVVAQSAYYFRRVRPSTCPSVCVFRRGSHPTDFRQIWKLL